MTPNQVYCWHVASQTAEYDSPFSEVFYFTTEEVLDVDDDEMINTFSLSQNYPNPFNPVTTISYSVPSNTRGTVNLQVFDVLGREVKTLIKRKLAPGNYEVKFDATDLLSGIYYYRLTVDHFSKARKMILLK